MGTLKIAAEFSYRGVRYAPGEPCPELDEAAVSALLGQRKLVEEGQPVPPAVEPSGPVQYLDGSDLVVLRRLRQHVPSAPMLLAMAELARRQSRSAVLVDAILALSER